MQASRGHRRRIQLLVAVALGAFTVLALRATWLGAVRSSSLAAKADNQHLITVNLPAPRGSIMSADERALAVDRPTMLVTGDARYVTDPERVAGEITSATGGTVKQRLFLENELRKRKAYVILARHVSIKQAQYLKDLDLAGVHFTRTSARSYPSGKTAGQLLGFTDLDSGKGIEGLEASRNEVLAGTPGKRIEVRDPKLGQTVRIAESRDPTSGKDIELTINAAVQAKLENSLAAARIRYGAKSAMGVVMNPQTGAIIAMTAIPRVDPNDRAGLDPSTTQNRAVTDPYEPGSVFKVVTAAGVLEEGLTTPDHRWNLPPTITINPNTPDEFTLEEAHKRTTYATLTTTEIIQKSSNIGTIELASLLRKRNLLRKWMATFGFGTKTEVDLAAENAANLPPVAKWNSASRINIPLGQGMTATMIQQVRAYAAIANGGELVQPYVVSRIGGHSVAPTKRTRILSERTSKQMTQILEEVVEGTDGTGVDASLENYTVAGKTGTAQKVDPKLGKYVDRYRSSFIGYVPSRTPKLLIAVMLDDPNPTGPHTGGQVAAPVFKEVADYSLSVLGIPPD